jgi:hypothetical protein
MFWRLLKYFIPDDEEGATDDFEEAKWWLDVIQTVARLLLNVFAGGMLTVGVGTHRQWEQFSACILAATTLAWALYHQKIRKKKRDKKRKKKRKDRNNEPKTQIHPPDDSGPSI